MNENDWIYALARKAYEAYCGACEWKSAITGADLPLFDSCKQEVKDGWIAVAKAMILEIGK
ncbi:MAG: hypothetical protein WC390_08685 [Sulfurimonas sp.]|jgi:hypothetical protein